MTDLYAAIESIARDPALPTATICDDLAVSRSAYYAWQAAEPGLRELELDNLTPAVVAIFWQHRRRYGARRIAAELKDRAVACSAKRVAKVLKRQGLRAIQPKSFVPKTTDSRHGLGYSPNRLLDAADPTRVDELWVADITYLPLRGGGFCYLAGLMDRFARAVVGWSVDASMTESLVLAALRRAIRARSARGGLGAPQRSRRPVRGHAVPGDAASRGDGGEHEPGGQLLRQRVHGKLLGNLQA